MVGGLEDNRIDEREVGHLEVSIVSIREQPFAKQIPGSDVHILIMVQVFVHVGVQQYKERHSKERRHKAQICKPAHVSTH